MGKVLINGVETDETYGDENTITNVFAGPDVAIAPAGDDFERQDSGLITEDPMIEENKVTDGFPKRMRVIGKGAIVWARYHDGNNDKIMGAIPTNSTVMVYAEERDHYKISENENRWILKVTAILDS